MKPCGEYVFGSKRTTLTKARSQDRGLTRREAPNWGSPNWGFPDQGSPDRGIPRPEVLKTCTRLTHRECPQIVVGSSDLGLKTGFGSQDQSALAQGLSCIRLGLPQGLLLHKACILLAHGFIAFEGFYFLINKI